MNIDTHNFNNFKYLVNYDIKGSVVIEHNKLKPTYLFKFYSISQNSVDAFTKGYLYASHPFELNDSLDSNKLLLISNQKLDFEFYKKFIGDTISKDELIKFYEEDIAREPYCKQYIDSHYDVTTNLFGVISTTSKENNTLMWPHYTQEKGFQIKFHTQKLENSISSKLLENEGYLGLFPVNYCDKLVPIDISQFQTMFIPIFYISNIKSNHWEYEDEWRFLIGKENMGVPYTNLGLHPREDYSINKENRYVYYDKEVIEEITLGKNFFNGKDFNIQWIDEKRINVKARVDRTNYKYLNTFLDYIASFLSDKLYHSGVKYEFNCDELTIIRTKEKMIIAKADNDSFLLTRTDNIIKFND